MDCSSTSSLELAAAIVRFEAVTRDWNLEASEKRAIIGLPAGANELGAIEGLAAEIETRMRLVVEVARLLDALLGADLLEWLRDDEDGQLTPLAFMSRGAIELRAMRAAASSRL